MGRARGILALKRPTAILVHLSRVGDSTTTLKLLLIGAERIIEEQKSEDFFCWVKFSRKPIPNLGSIHGHIIFLVVHKQSTRCLRTH